MDVLHSTLWQNVVSQNRTLFSYQAYKACIQYLSSLWVVQMWNHSMSCELKHFFFHMWNNFTSKIVIVTCSKPSASVVQISPPHPKYLKTQFCQQEIFENETFIWLLSCCSLSSKRCPAGCGEPSATHTPKRIALKFKKHRIPCGDNRRSPAMRTAVTPPTAATLW